MKKSIFLPLAMLLCLLAACEHKDLCYDHTHTAEVKVVFDWRHASQVQPSSMRLYLYPADGGKMLPYEFAGRNGGVITIPGGSYRALCINNDAESVIYTGVETFEGFEASTTNSTKTGYPRTVRGYADPETESLHRSPEMLWTDRRDDIHIVLGVKDQTITLYPDTSVCLYTVEIRNAKNLKDLSPFAISGSLTGLSEGFLVGRNKLDDNLTTVPFEAQHDQVSTIKASFLGFGHKRDANLKHWLFIYVRMPDGKNYYHTYDVTDQLLRATDKHHVHILLDGLPLPKPIENGNGLQPKVDDWEEVIVDIPM